MHELILPLVTEIPYQTPQHLFAFFADKPWSLLLESAYHHEEIGRYSFIGIDPFLKIVSKYDEISVNGINSKAQPFSVLQKFLNEFRLQTHPNMVPFQGGAIGYFGYELAWHFESLNFNNTDDLQLPDMMVGFYDLVIAFDHINKKAFIFSSGFPKFDMHERIVYAKERTAWLQQQFKNEYTPTHFSSNVVPQSNFTQQNYQQAVRKALAYINAGDIFQVNLSQRFSGKWDETANSFALYQHLTKINPTSFAAHMNFDDIAIISASPERFLKLTDKMVETRPIKGTIKRGKTVAEDQKLAKKLQECPKNRAENIMIVDLLRNDLSRVCEPHSVKVDKLCTTETYSTLHHLVSVIKGKLKTTHTALDLLSVCLPGGSITGAPKIRAMQIINELESVHRGIYCGAIGYIGFDGKMDTAITIRTFVIKNEQITFHVGGGIVAESDPEQEYQETLLKAQSLLSALLGKV